MAHMLQNAQLIQTLYGAAELQPRVELAAISVQQKYESSLLFWLFW